MTHDQIAAALAAPWGEAASAAPALHGGPAPFNNPGHSPEANGGFAHPGEREGCVLCRLDNHWHNCVRLGCDRPAADDNVIYLNADAAASREW